MDALLILQILSLIFALLLLLIMVMPLLSSTISVRFTVKETSPRMSIRNILPIPTKKTLVDVIEDENISHEGWYPTRNQDRKL